MKTFNLYKWALLLVIYLAGNMFCAKALSNNDPIKAGKISLKYGADLSKITIKTGTNVNIIYNIQDASGGQEGAAYLWQRSIDNVNWSDVGWDLNYHNPHPKNISVTTYFRRSYVFAGTTVYSNTVTVEVVNFNLTPSPSSRYGYGSVTLSASGVVDGLHYQWYDNYVLIKGATNAEFITPGLTNNKIYQVALVNEIGNEFNKTSVVASVNIIERPRKPLLISGGSGTSDKLEKSVWDSNSSYTYYWQSSPDETDETYSGNEYTPTETGVYYLRAKKNGTEEWGQASEGQAVTIYNTAPTGIANTPVNASETSLIAKGNLSFYTNQGNYVRTYTALKGELTEAEFNMSIDKNKASVTTAYVDGLGRATQSVTKQGAPEIGGEANDIVQALEYDVLGRQKKSYLPYVASSTSGEFQVNALDDQYNFYANTSNIANTGVAYSEKVMEDSPLGRVLAEFAPGESWVGSKGSADEKKVSMNTRSNTATEVIRWDIDANGDAVILDMVVPYYNYGELMVSEITDEQGNLVQEFKSKTGQVIVKKVQSGGDANNPVFAETYYTYDDHGNLRYVFPPQFMEEYVIGNSIYNIKNKYAFQYEYDDRNRLIKKKVPGSGEVLMVYDQLDRLVMTQDAKQAEEGTWLFTKYDYLSRPVITGILTDSDKNIGDRRAYFQNEVNNHSVLSVNPNIKTADVDFSEGEGLLQGVILEVSLFEGHTQYLAQEHIELLPSFDMDATALNKSLDIQTGALDNTKGAWVQGYFDQTYPANINLEYLTVSYYDDYDFTNDGLIDFKYDDSFNTSFEAPIKSPEPFNRIRGQIAGSKVKNLKTGEWLTTVTFYDDRGRVIQTQADNHKGGTDILTTAYDFTGKPEQTVLSHTAHGATKKIEKFFFYDHAGRLLTVNQEVNDNGHLETITTNTYNKLGELISKDIGNGVQQVDYKYNIRGWMTDINDVDNLGADDVFAMQLSYEKGFDQVQYNGNISGQKWKTASSDMVRAYGYQYDKLNRLTRADYRADNGSNTWNQEVDQFSTFDINYDLNGNILTMARQGLTTINEVNGEQTFAAMDRMVYSYEGNRLIAVDDKEDNNTKDLAKDFYDKDIKYHTSGIEEYEYDENGNLFKDVNKGIENITYNHLNLPSLIDFGGGKTLEYVYDAAGIKLQKITTDENGKVTTTDYIGEFVYENGKLQFFHTEEGRAVPEKINNVAVAGGGFDYEYTLKDHLGNARVTASNKQLKYVATMETENLEVEKNEFGNIEETQIIGIGHNSNAASLVKVNQDGPSKTIKVGKGDEVEATVYSLFFSHGSSNSYTYGTTNINNPQEGSSNISGSVINNSSGSSSAPVAYLKMVFTPEGSGTGIEDYVSVTNLAGQFNQIGLNFTSDSDGELTIFVINESSADVIFDDFEIKHRQKVVQENHYYGFGMQISGIGKEGSNKFLFNQGTKKNFQGKEGKSFRVEREEELGWDMTKLRMYDYQLGRFNSVDPLADAAPQENQTPYQYAYNNPAKYNDPYGDCPTCIIGGIVGGAVSAGIAIWEGKDTGDVLIAAAGGAINGAIVGSGVGLVAELGIGLGGAVAFNAAAGFLGGAAQETTTQGLQVLSDKREGFDTGKIVQNAAVGMAANVVGGAVVDGVVAPVVNKAIAKTTATEIAQATSLQSQKQIQKSVLKMTPNLKNNNKKMAEEVGKAIKTRVKDAKSYASLKTKVINTGTQVAAETAGQNAGNSTNEVLDKNKKRQ